MGRLSSFACIGVLFAACTGCVEVESFSGGGDEEAFKHHWAEAVPAMQRALESAPKGGDAFLAPADLFTQAADDTEFQGHRLAALFFAGEARFLHREYEEAHDCFRKILEKDSDASGLEQAFRPGTSLPDPSPLLKAILGPTPRLGNALFAHIIDRETRIAFLFLGGEKQAFLGLAILSGRDLAADILRTVTALSPYADRTPQALYELGNYLVDEGELDKAIETYETLIREHPENVWRPAAEYLIARSYFQKNADISRDTHNLKRALLRFRIFLKNNLDLSLLQISPGNTVDLVKNATQYVKKIRGLLAEKNYDIARYYLSKSRPAAARVYLMVLLKDFQGTKWATLAKKILAQEEEEKK
jgi:tetratricopeptide (TPR) repeat protein